MMLSSQRAVKSTNPVNEFPVKHSIDDGPQAYFFVEGGEGSAGVLRVFLSREQRG